MKRVNLSCIIVDTEEKVLPKYTLKQYFAFQAYRQSASE